MGKWTSFRGLEGRYFVDCANRVVQLQRYLYQVYYAGPDGERVCVDNLDRVFSSKEEAEALSKKELAALKEKQRVWAQERLQEEEAERARIESLRRKPDYLDNLGFSEAKYYLDD